MSSLTAKCKPYIALCKIRVVLLMLWCSWTGMLLTPHAFQHWDAMLFATLGIGLCAAGGAALNHFGDRFYDGLMQRTAHRPLPNGELSAYEVLIFAGTVILLGALLLLLGTNRMTMIYTLLTTGGYAIVYTLFLKRSSPQNIVIGGLSGAMPPLLGWMALANNIDARPLLLVLMIFLWTPPHFWALCLYRHHEYEKIDLPMLPQTHGKSFTRLNIWLYALLMVAASLLPYAIHMLGIVYLIGLIPLNFLWLKYAYRLWQHGDNCKQFFIFSIQYLAAYFLLVIVDTMIPYA